MPFFLTQKYQFKFKPLATLFFCLVLMLLISLSLWQLTRAKEKATLLQRYEHSIKQPTLDLTTLDNWQQLPLFQQVRLRGHYDNQHQFLLDNRMKKGQAGYEVLTPFYSDQRLIMINRGWIPRLSSRRQLPSLAVIHGEQQIIGRIVNLPHHSFRLGKVEENPQQWPRIIQGLDSTTLTHALGKTIPPVIIQLAAEAPHGFVRDWSITTIKPEKHLGYAVQWGLLALVQLIVLLRYNFQRIPI